MKAKRDSRTEQHPQGDRIKWMLIFVLLVIGIGANYHWHDFAWSLRFAVGILLACGILGLAAWTKKGKAAWHFVVESRREMRKVVWPPRKETIQVAIMIVIVVMVMAIILWCVDSVLMGIVGKLTS